ncbi:MAG: tyrosine-type recombinase/integrase [Cyanobacteria bacterium J06635_15]
MTRNSFANRLNKLAKERSICNSLGQTWHFKPHDFRHTVGTRMINAGVPQHIIQRYLGHESPAMTATYAHIHSETLKKEIAKFQGKVVNVSGQVVEPNNIEADDVELQWFKKNIQAQSLPNGSCALPTISQGCPHANACLTCTHFRTTTEHLSDHKEQLEQTKRLIQKAQANGWVGQIEMNEKVKANLERIIAGLEGQNDESQA